LADIAKENIDVVVEEVSQPNRGNKISKKNKKKNKNLDWNDVDEGMYYSIHFKKN